MKYTENLIVMLFLCMVRFVLLFLWMLDEIFFEFILDKSSFLSHRHQL